MASSKRDRHRQRRLIQENATTVAEVVRGDLVPVGEAGVRGDGTIAVRLISPGWGTSGYYSPACLEAAGADRVFPAGTQMFWDHPTSTEAMDRPERSLRDLAAVLETDAVWHANHLEGPGLYAQAKVFAPFRPVLTEIAKDIGVSIRAGAEVSTGVIEGRRGRIVERIVEGKSVDFVTKPGRGGQVLAIFESLRESGMWRDDLWQAMRDALNARFEPGDGESLWIRDFNDTEVVFNREGGDQHGSWMLGYTLDGDTVALSDDEPVQVKVTTSYAPVGEAYTAVPVEEARNVGQWIESHLHMRFTVMCDEMAAEGRLTREERIGLSSAIGDALRVFVTAVEQTAPQLYQRDLFDEPADPTHLPMEEAMKPEEIEEAVAKAVDARVAPLVEANQTLSTEIKETKAENDKLRTGLLVRDAREHARRKVEAVEGLSSSVKAKIVEAVTDSPALTEDGQIDIAKLDEAITAEIKSWAAILTEHGGSGVRGVGDDTTTHTTEELDEALGDMFKDFGLSEAAAKTAVAEL